MTNVSLTDEQCEVFRLLAQAGAWNGGGASYEIYFDWNGTPTKVRKSEWHLSTPRSGGDTLTVVIG